MIIRALTFNLWNINEPLYERMDKFIRYLNVSRPDVIALQEVSPMASLRQSDYIASKANYPFVHYVRNGDWRNREEGLAVLTRFKCSRSEIIRLPLAEGDMPRSLQCLELILDQANSPILILNTHLAYHINARVGRTKQISMAIEALNDLVKYRALPVIFCGDFNDTPDSEPVRMLFSQSNPALRDAWLAAGNQSEGHTFAKDNPWASPELWPGRRIDYIGVSEEVNVHSCYLAMTPSDNWGLASDHYAVIAELSLTPQ